MRHYYFRVTLGFRGVFFPLKNVISKILVDLCNPGRSFKEPDKCFLLRKKRHIERIVYSTRQHLGTLL